jgi:hypothetical protein
MGNPRWEHMPIHLVQLRAGTQRRIALVEEPRLRLLRQFGSTYALAQAAIGQSNRLGALVEESRTDEFLDYDAVYQDRSDWKLLCPIDHPDEPSRCLVSGTGLTHLGSARDRQAMHLGTDESALSDSMRMFRWGIERGKPPAGQAGVAPEWFYKGNGTILRAHNQPLEVPAFAEDGGEEAEIAGVYLIGPNGQPHRLGMTVGNEFSDHVFEKKNYLNLAGSKLRTCSIGPELVIDPQFQSVPGHVTIERGGQALWSHDILTGEQEMCHSLANIEHHQFKFAQHRRPGDVHIHFYGAHSLSFGQGIALADGDVMHVRFDNFGRPLRNVLRREPHDPQRLVSVQRLS